MVILRNSRVVDVKRGSIRETAVAIENEKVAGFGDSEEREDVLDLEGAYLLPGLVNGHVHLGDVFPFCEADANEGKSIHVLRCLRRGRDALLAGVTTVRTEGTRYGVDADLRTMINRGWVEGPRILAARQALRVTGGQGDDVGAVSADGAQEFQKRAREQLSAGADHLKIFITGGLSVQEGVLDQPQMTDDEMEAVVTVARSKNTYVSAHAASGKAIVQAARRGVRSFEHGYALDREAAREIRERGGYYCPTLCVTHCQDWMDRNRFEPWAMEKARDAASCHMESVRVAIQEGVRIVAGTDLPPGDADGGINVTVRELEFLVSAGLSPLESLQASLLNGATLMGIERQVGRVELGYQADLIATRENPLKDIQALREIFFVMQSGKVIRWGQQNRW
jgi:imidazolonepropionase-like amidohydrolase